MKLSSLTALRCFDASARLGSFTKAGLQLHLSQGAVSHQVLSLEERLGFALFVRDKKGLQLSHAGRTYWHDISNALQLIDRATQLAISTKGEGGALNICVASSFASYWLMPRLNRFVASFPHITLNLTTHNGPVDFYSKPHDAAIEFCTGNEIGLSAEKLLPLVLRPYIAKKMVQNLDLAKLTADQLSDMFDNNSLIQNTTMPNAWQSWLSVSKIALPSDVGARMANGAQYDLMSMALNAAIAGLGIALLPDFMVKNPLESGQIVCLSEMGWTAEKAYYLRYPSSKSKSTVLQAFETWLRSEIAASQQELQP